MSWTRLRLVFYRWIDLDHWNRSCPSWTVEEILLKESDQKCPTCFVLVLDRWKLVLLKESYITSWLGLILDSCFNRWKRPPRQKSWTHPARLRPLGLVLDRWNCRLVEVLLPSWTVESARPLTESTPRPTHLLLLNRTAKSVRLVKESDLLTASVILKASYVLDCWKCPSCQSVLLVLDSCWTTWTPLIVEEVPVNESFPS